MTTDDTAQIDACFAYMTAGDIAEARLIARTIVDERLAACANILPEMESFYHWDGAVQSDREVVIIAKTPRRLFEKLRERVVELHSYDCPCVVALDLVDGHPAFLDWIAAQTAS